MTESDTQAELLRMIRLAPAILRSDDASFIRHVYREGLGREPEFDPAGAAAPSLEGDIYLERANFICAVATSEESLRRQYGETLNAFAAMLGHKLYQPMFVKLLRVIYPTPDEFIAARTLLAERINVNSRRQDAIVAMCAFG